VTFVIQTLWSPEDKDMMSVSKSPSEFFVAGGTLHPDAPSYVKRPADDELFSLALAGGFCYVLTPRQMGKSSLIARTAKRLKERGVNTASIDLTKIGTNVTVEQWYLGLLVQLKRSLRFSVDPVAWWQARASLGYVQRFTDFLRQVILTEIEGQVVIFIDEIDTTLKLEFTDDFFAAIRAMYNARADDPEFERLTFVLLGVASPPDLIKDRTRTPFNIGQGIALQEFSQSDAAVLQAGLEAFYPGQGEAIFARIYHWTNGHPYLTQKLCLAAVGTGDNRWTSERVDELVERLFLSEEARKETNLQFVQDKILTHPQRRELLTLYKKVLGGKRVRDDGQSPVQNQLKLSGLVEAENGYLRIRNEIYRRAFDLTWVRENTAINRAYVVAGAAVFVALLAVGFTFYNSVACRLFPRERWCPQNDQNLRGKTVFALAGCGDGTLFAGAVDGIYRRAGGDTEWKLEQSTKGEVRGLVANPDCTLAYAAALNHGVLRRAGRSWSVVSSPDMARAWTVALSADVVLAGGDFGVRYSGADAVHIWAVPQAFVDKTTVSLVRSDAQIYAAVWGSGVWSCNGDNLEQCLPVNDGLDTEYARQAIGSPTNGAPGFAGVDDGFYRWNGTRWEKGPEEWGDTFTFWFVIDGATVYAGQENNGVLRSTDGGLTWEQMNDGWRTPPFRVHTLLIHIDEDSNRYLYAGTSEGVWRYLLPKVSLFCNGDFERSFKCWQYGGELDQTVKRDGDQRYAVLGNPGYPCYGGVPVGEAWIKQKVKVSSQEISPTLSLKYRVFSYDLDLPGCDYFQVAVNGELLHQYGNYEWIEPSCDGEPWDSGWQTLTLDLSPYRGKEIEVSFHNVNGTQPYYNTWTYVDDVRIDEIH